MTRSQREDLNGRYVEFYIRDVHLPDPAAILQELFSGKTLAGKIVDFSARGPEGGGFVVIEVDRLHHQPIVLAVEKILRVL